MRRPTNAAAGWPARSWRAGVGLGDTVSIMAPNVPAMLEAHFGVPMAGAVLNALNIRLDAASIAWMLNHARSRVLIADSAAFAGPVVEEALAQVDRRPHVVAIDDPRSRTGKGRDLADESYEALLAASARRTSHGPGPKTSGRRSRSTTRRAPRAGRKGSSITTGAPT